MADLIDRHKAINAVKRNAPYRYKHVENAILEDINVIPSVDAVEVVRCADCKHCQVDTLYHNYLCDGQSVFADHYCSKGERR